MTCNRIRGGQRGAAGELKGREIRQIEECPVRERERKGESMGK